jgi:hypothetical protein
MLQDVQALSAFTRPADGWLLVSAILKRANETIGMKPIKVGAGWKTFLSIQWVELVFCLEKIAGRMIVRGEEDDIVRILSLLRTASGFEPTAPFFKEAIASLYKEWDSKQVVRHVAA